jgi:hypothetical protein
MYTAPSKEAAEYESPWQSSTHFVVPVAQSALNAPSRLPPPPKVEPVP